jgi:hypothetical protein
MHRSFSWGLAGEEEARHLPSLLDVQTIKLEETRKTSISMPKIMILFSILT